MKINFTEIFESLTDTDYCIIKLPPDLANYRIGSDIDILCINNKSVAEIIISKLNKYIDTKSIVKITEYEDQSHVDFLEDNRIHLRFDLYQKLPHYKNILLKPEYFSSILENSKATIKGDIRIKVPSDLDDLIIRYFEYQEYYSERPDKIKHIDYIENLIEERDLDRKKLFDRIHYYTEIPPINNKGSRASSNFRNLKYFIKKIDGGWKYFRQHGLFNTIRRIMKSK